MKNVIKIMMLCSLLSISCSKDDNEDPNKLVLPATIENTAELAVPDAVGAGTCGSGVTPGGTENTVTIDKNGTIGDPLKVSIEVDLVHPYGGDIVLELVAPSGDICTLIKRVGSAATDAACGSDVIFIAGNLLVFNAANETAIDAALNVVPAGNYAPSAGLSAFPEEAVMVGLDEFLQDQDINGVWTMKIQDYGKGDLGKLLSWKLKFEEGALK